MHKFSLHGLQPGVLMSGQLGVISGQFATELGFVLSEELRPDVIDTLTDMSIIMPLTVQYM